MANWHVQKRKNIKLEKKRKGRRKDKRKEVGRGKRRQKIVKMMSKRPLLRDV